MSLEQVHHTPQSSQSAEMKHLQPATARGDYLHPYGAQLDRPGMSGDHRSGSGADVTRPGGSSASPGEIAASAYRPSDALTARTHEVLNRIGQAIGDKTLEPQASSSLEQRAGIGPNGALNRVNETLDRIDQTIGAKAGETQASSLPGQRPEIGSDTARAGTSASNAAEIASQAYGSNSHGLRETGGPSSEVSIPRQTWQPEIVQARGGSSKGDKQPSAGEERAGRVQNERAQREEQFQRDQNQRIYEEREEAYRRGMENRVYYERKEQESRRRGS